MTLVSGIVTTCKRNPEIVLRAVRSILSQTWPRMEVIVVDDSPKDFPHRAALREQLEQLRRETEIPVRYIAHDACRGACAARNTGLMASEGEIIGYLDDDDEWLPQKVEIMLPLLEKQPNVALVYCGNLLYNDTLGTEQPVHRPQRRGKVYPELIRRNFIGSTSFPLLRKEALLSIDGFDLEMRSAQDADVWLRLSERYDVDCVEDCLVRYHVHEGEQISKNLDKRIAGMERINLKNRMYLKEHPEAWWIRRMKLVPLYAANGDQKQARKIWLECFMKQPFRRGNLFYLKKLRNSSPGAAMTEES